MAKEKESLKFEIMNELGIIAAKPKGWNLELNRISWNGNAPKYDIRTWNEDHTKMGKGVTLTEEDIRQLKALLEREISYLNDL